MHVQRKTPFAYRRALRGPRPRWSIRTTVGAAVAIVAIVSAITLLVLRRPLWVELEAVTGLLSIVTFMFLGHVLYRGVRFLKHERFEFSLRTVELGDLWHGADALPDSLDFSDAVDAADGVLGFLLGVLVSIVLVIVLALVLWIGLNVAVNAVAIVSLPLFYLFRRSLRQVVARGRTCHGRLGRSVRVAAQMTFLYMGWLYSLIYLAHRLHAALPA